MKTSVTLTFVGLFAAVAIFYYFLGTPLSKPEAPVVTSGDAKLLPFSPDQTLRLIQIQKLSDRETLTLEQSENEWYLRHPVNYLADKRMAEGLMTALRVSTKARRLMREKGWEEYGLSRPEIKIGVEAEGKTQRKYLLLGDKSPVSDLIFARWEGENEFFLVDARIKSAFDRSVYSLREKRIVRVPIQNVDKIHVQTFEGNYEISRQEGKWYWTEPIARIGKKIAEEQAYQLLLLLHELYIKAFLDGESLEGKDLGLLRSAPYLQVWAQDKTSTLGLGKEIPNRDAYYGLIEGETVPLEISKDVISKFFKIFDRTQEAEEKEPLPLPSAAPAEPAAPATVS